MFEVLRRVSLFCAIALTIALLAFLHEAIEIFGHGHPYEMEDVAIDASGAVIGLILAQVAMKIASIKQR
jgi:VanZ family protein